MTMDTTAESSRKRKNRRIMREKKNAQLHRDQSPGTGPSTSSEMASPAAKKRKRMDSSSSLSAPGPSTQSSPVASTRLDTSNTNDTTQNTSRRGNPDDQPPTDEGVDATLRALDHRRAELENMKDTITQQRGEKKKVEVAMDLMKSMIEGLKRSVVELREAAEAMQTRGRELETTIEEMSSKNAAQGLELEKLRVRARVLEQDKAKALEGQASCRRRLAKLLWDHDPRDSAAKSAKPVDGLGSEDGEGAGTSSGPDTGAVPPGSAEQQTNQANETDDELKKRLDEATEVSRRLEEKLQVANQGLEASLKREEELRNANDTALKNHEDLKKQLADTLTAHYQLVQSNREISVLEKGSLAEDAGGAEVKVMQAREAQALEKVKQYKAHNMELKIARDVMRKKLIEVAAARSELETTLAQTKTDLAESQKALSESQTSYVAVKKTLFETDASLSRSRAALVKSNQDLLKGGERYRELGTYTDSWRSICFSERAATTSLLSQLSGASTEVKNAIQKTESLNTPSEADAAIPQDALLNVKNTIHTLIGLINAEINRRLVTNNDWFSAGKNPLSPGLSAITSTSPASVTLAAMPAVIQIPPSSPPAHQQNENKKKH